VIRWQPPGPYEVVFSTRNGGVSTGAYESLNLGALTQDDPANVVENRRRLCAEIGADPAQATMPYQRHSKDVRRADGRGIDIPGTRFEECDALWTDEPERPVLVLAADCVPVALARRNGDRPAVAVVHVGWRGLLGGVVRNALAALGTSTAAAIGPAIGPCCYEVRDDVAAPFRERFGASIVADGRLDLWTAAESELRGAGCAIVERLDLCTFCHPQLFFSHRRDRGLTGRQGVIAAVAG
jgi:YfiH family protein